MSKQEQTVVEEEATGYYLSFLLSSERFTIEMTYIKEMISFQPITRVPFLPEEIKGIIHLRGKIIPVMDMHIKLSKPLVSYNERTCIIIIQKQQEELGLIVDEVEEVVVIKKETYMPLKKEEKACPLIKGVIQKEKNIWYMVDCEWLLEGKV